MPFAAAWMGLKIITLSKSERERQISYNITHMWNLIFKKYINELQNTHTHIQTYGYKKQTSDHQRGNVVERDRSEAWYEHKHTTIHMITK